MNELKVYSSKTNVILTLIFPMFIFMLIILCFIINPITAHAEEPSSYVYNITVKQVTTKKSDSNFNITSNYNATIESDSRICAVKENYGNTYGGISFVYLNGNILDSKKILFDYEKNDNGSITKNTLNTSGIGQAWGYSENNEYIDNYSYVTNMCVFTTNDEAKNYLQTGDDTGNINKYIDMSKATYNADIPIPKLVFNSQGGYKFKIDNAVDGYYIQIKGRWYSVDDITLFKENLQWKYKYDTLLKGPLTEWVKPNDKILATAEHDLCDYNRNGYGGEAFTALLTQYGIEQRNYSGGTNALGNKLSGYTDALSSLKEIHLNNPESAFNSPEIYIRFIVVNEDKSVNYGKWCHWYSNLANAAGSSGFNLDDSDNVSGESQSFNGLTDDDLNNNEKQENPRNDSDIYTYVNSDYIKQNIEISSDIANKTGAFFELLNSMLSAMGQFPQMFKEVFMFLPPWFINFIVIAMGAIIIARFIGR